MDASETDRDVMGRLAGGDREALAEMMRRWGPKIWCYIERACARLDCSEDLYQEVWMRVFLHRERYDPAREFRPYLFTIAANCCRTALSRGARRAGRQRRLDDDTSGTVDPQASQPLQTVIRREEKDRLHRAVDDLPPAQRDVVLLYLLCSADYGEIASVLKKKPGTLRVHMHQALRRLRRVLGQATPDVATEVNHESDVS